MHAWHTSGRFAEVGQWLADHNASNEVSQNLAECSRRTFGIATKGGLVLLYGWSSQLQFLCRARQREIALEPRNSSFCGAGKD
jgi:hypothetical protein